VTKAVAPEPAAPKHPKKLLVQRQRKAK